MTGQSFWLNLRPSVYPCLYRKAAGRVGVPKQRLWVSSGASTGENSQLYKNKLLIVKWRSWPEVETREAEFLFRNVSALFHRVRNQVWVYIARVIVRLRDVPGVPKQLGCVSVTQIFRYVYIVVLFSLLPVRYNVHRCSVLSQKH